MKILILRLSSIGDIVLTQPVVAALVKHYPTAEIHYLTKKPFRPIVEAFGFPIIIYNWEELKSFGALLKFGRSHKFDLVVDLHNKFNTLLIKTIVAGKKTVTYEKHHLLRRKIVNHKTTKTISSTVKLYFTSLKKLGIVDKFSYPILTASNLDNPKILKLLSKEPEQKLIGVFPGAQHKTKQYPVDQLLEALILISQNSNCKFVILGSASEKHLAEYLTHNSKLNIIDLCGELSIKELIEVTSKLDFVISNDSGPMHIAAALNKPQLAIFGATHPKLGFAPLNKRAIILTAELTCQPCSLHGGASCPLQHFNCMKNVSFESVAKEINQLI